MVSNREPRGYRYAVLAAIGSLILGASNVAATVSPPTSHAVVIPQPQPCRAETYSCSQKATTEQRPKEPSWNAALNDPTVVFTGALVFATFGLWLFTALLWRVTARIASDARLSGETQADKMDKSINAVLETNRITLDSQRPWIAISCEIEKFNNFKGGPLISVNINFHNTGAIAALNYYSSNSIEVFDYSEKDVVRDKIKEIWKKFRENDPNSGYVLIPTETDTQHHLTIKRFDFSIERASEIESPNPIDCQKSFSIIIVAGAYYKIPGSDDWHATERSFIVTIRREPLFMPEEWIDERIPNQDFPSEQILVRQIFSGETS